MMTKQMTLQEEIQSDTFSRIETPIQLVKCGSKTIGLPPRLEQPEIFALIEAVNNEARLTPAEASLLLWLFNQPDLFNML